MYVSMEALQGWEMGRASLSVCHQHLSYTLGCTSLHPGSPAIHIWGTVLLEGKAAGGGGGTCSHKNRCRNSMYLWGIGKGC